MAITGFQARQVYKFVKDASFTPDGGSEISIPGIKRVEVGQSLTTASSQVANNVRADVNIDQLYNDTVRFVFEDAQLFDFSTNLYAGAWGSFTCKNEAHTGAASDKTYTVSPCKIVDVSTTMEAGSGAQEINVDCEVWAQDGTTNPLSLA